MLKKKLYLFSQEKRELTLARKIMLLVMRYRRIAGRKKSCAISLCEACLGPHINQVVTAIRNEQPISFVLPAFPAKSPNPAKVLGTRPDMAERLALRFLNDLCHEIKNFYATGAEMIICSDGRVFNDVVGIHDEDVSAYQRELCKLIKENSLTSISIFNLDDIYAGLDFDQMRQQLMMHYGRPIDELKASVRKGGKIDGSIDDKEVNRHYCGTTRFLVEDAMREGQTLSRNALQNDCRMRAYIVIQRSRAWSDLIAAHLPYAVRLSIHPQACGSSKLGIRLLEGDNWMTPWHGVAVDVGGKFVLLKRVQAEQLGGRLIYREGRPSHYVLVEGGTYAT